MSKKYIGITGSCATGKSTRVNRLVDFLGEPISKHTYTFNKGGKERTIDLGWLYSDGLFIAGRKTNGGNWAGADYVFGKLGNKDNILPAIEHVLTFADTFLIEGYFAVGSQFLRAISLSRYVDNFSQYYFTYDNLQEYIDRTEGRTGRTWEEQGKDPITSAGWKSNQGFKNTMPKSQAELDETGMKGEIVDLTKDADINYFIERYQTGRL